MSKAKPIRASMEATREHYGNNTWILTALMGGVFFSVGNFLMGSISTGGLYAREVIMMGNFIAAIVYSLIMSKSLS